MRLTPLARSARPEREVADVRRVEALHEVLLDAARVVAEHVDHLVLHEEADRLAHADEIMFDVKPRKIVAFVRARTAGSLKSSSSSSFTGTSLRRHARCEVARSSEERIRAPRATCRTID